MIGRLLILVQIALRNLLGSKMNLLVGFLIFLTTVFFVVIGSTFESLVSSMSKSVTSSVAGDVQVYSSSSKDELELFGNFGNDSDIGVVTNYPKLKQELEKLPNVKTVVPMGISGALIQSGNTVDQALEKLRGLYNARAQKTAGPDVETQIAASKDHVRQMVRVLEDDADKIKAIADESKVDKDSIAALNRALGNEFWEHFDEDAYGSLEFLENKIAPQVSDANMVFFRYLGTDLDLFQHSFDRMKIVDGTAVPKGQRGLLLAKFVYEDQLKLKSARRLDKIHDSLTAGVRTIKSDSDFQRYIKECQSQTRDITLQLDSIKTKAVVALLQKEVQSNEVDLDKLLVAFFALTDENFDERYRFFYDQLAPMIELYKVRVGDILTIKAFTKSGYVKSVNMKVYGTFSFEGIEKSPLAGAFSLVDLMSFRDLYGYVSNETAAELKAIKKETGAREIDRENAEEDLFGASAPKDVVVTATQGTIDEAKEMSGTAKHQRNDDLNGRVYTQEEIDNGVILDAAIILKEGNPATIDSAVAQINSISQAQGLGIKAVTWIDAAGALGKIIKGLRFILAIAVAIIFIVAGIIMLIAMMTTTLQRTQVFGTLRAIGAQGDFVLRMVLIEALFVGVAFGFIGLAVGSGLVTWMGHHGIAATNDYAYFFFAGPRFSPAVNSFNVILAAVLVLVTTAIAAFIPAFMATRISPLAAMQTDE